MPFGAPASHVCWRRVLLVWLIIAAVESVHGTARELLVAPLVGDLRARQLAVLTGSILILAIAMDFRGWIGGGNRRSLLAVGAVWVMLTAAFEMALGLALGRGVSRLAEDYNVRRGGLMLFGLLVLLHAPLIAALVEERRAEWALRTGADG